LLVPTLAVLILVAARPLEQTFIASLTNQQFAGTRETEFVGLSNYTELLGFRFDTIGCERGEDGACVIEEDDGELQTVFPRSLSFLRDQSESYQNLNFRPIQEIRVPFASDQQLVLSVRDRAFFNAFENTLFYTFFAVLLEFLLGMIIALTVNARFPGRGFMRAAMLVPWAIPTVVSARLWEVMLRDNQSGVINSFFTGIGVFDGPQAWLATTDLQLWSLIFVDVWKTTPFMALLLLAGLQTIPSDIYEAADVDGASKVRQFFSLTLPLLRPTIAVALVFRTLDSLRAFDVFDVLLGRQRQSLATYNSQVLIENQEFGYASAIGVTIFIIILIFTVIYVRLLGVDAE
jgi:trehalose/maltose transport system permease protein